MAQSFPDIDQDANTQAFDDFDTRSESLRSTFAGTSAPSDPPPVEGQLWYKTDTDTLYVYNGSSWILVPLSGYTPPLVVVADFPGMQTQAADATEAYLFNIPPTAGTWRIISVTAYCRLADDVGPSPGATTFRCAATWQSSPTTNYWQVQIGTGAKSAKATTAANGNLDVAYNGTFAVWISTTGGHSDVKVAVALERVS